MSMPFPPQGSGQENSHRSGLMTLHSAWLTDQLQAWLTATEQYFTRCEESKYRAGSVTLEQQAARFTQEYLEKTELLCTARQLVSEVLRG